MTADAQAPGSGRVRLAAGVGAALVAAVLLAVLVLDRGSAGAGQGSLAFNGEPLVFEAEGMPGDWVMRADLRNAGREDVDLAFTEVRVLDRDGRELKSSMRFLAAFAHGLYPPDERDDSQVGDFEKRRLGEIATVPPDGEIPVTLSWRVPPGGAPAASIDFGPARIDIPARP